MTWYLQLLLFIDVILRLLLILIMSLTQILSDNDPRVLKLKSFQKTITDTDNYDLSL